MIPTQHILFGEYLPDVCQCNVTTFKLLAKLEDYCQFQVKLSPCTGVENVLCNPTFSPSEFTCNNWSTTGGFSLDDKACCTEATGAVTQAGTLVIGNIYQCDILIESITGEVYVYNGPTLVATITNIGTTTFTFAATSQDISLQISDEANSACVLSLAARPISLNMGFGIINSAGATVNVATYSSNPEYFTFSKDTVTITFQWNDFNVSNGQCYTIGFADGCTNINGQFGVFNGSFDNCLTGWTATQGTLTGLTCEDLENPETGVVENCIQFVNTGTGYITNFVTELKVGLSYEVTVDAMTDDADGVIRIYCGTNFADFTTSGQTNTIVCAGNTTFKIEAILNTATFVRLWGVSLELTNLSDTEFDEESHPFKIGGNECTLLVNLSNDDDAFGLVFEGSNFAPMLRLESEIVNLIPETIKESYHDNLGTKQVNFGEVRDRLQFNVDYVPPWIIRFLAWCNIADHFFIEGTEYFIEEDELEPQYPEGICYKNMASVQMEISVKTQLARNADIGNDPNPITIGDVVYLVTPDGDGIVEMFSQTEIIVR